MKALFVGLNTVDLQFFVNGYPEANTKTKAHRNEVAAGGPATNAAIACAHLGAQTTLLSPIGKHSLSRFLTDDIVSKNLQLIDPIENIESKPVFASIITDEINGERTIFSYHPENNFEQLLAELNLENLDEYAIALFDGFYPDLAIPLAKHLQEKGVTTVLDGGSWKPALHELLPHIDIAICSNDFKPPGTNISAEVFSKIQEYGVKKVAITRGEKPILFIEQEVKGEVNVPRVEVVDTLGAGDFFHGAFSHYFVKTASFEKALEQAAHFAAETCRYHGTRSWQKHNKLK